MYRSLAVLLGLALCVVFMRWSKLSDRYLEHLTALERLLASPVTPVVAGVINAVLVWWWMGWEWSPLPMIHDEAAYLLQAELFARGRWTGAARPLPEFFAQMYVLTEPVLASKYPPGLSLLLAPFVAIDFAALGPMLFAAVSGALLFVLARRVAGGPVALLTWLLWSSASALLRFQASFLSQTATVALWLGALYLLLEYRTHRRTRSLVALGACVGALAITRPVTALALAVPVGAVMLVDTYRRRAWRPLLLAGATGAAVVAILPLHNQMTTGDWRLSPLVAYSRAYTPFDFPGFGYTARRQLAPLPPDLDSVRTFLTEARRRHTLATLPVTLRSRVWYVTLDLFSGWRSAFVLFAVVGALVMPAGAQFALVASLSLLLAHALHAHWPFWTVYYFEGYPALIFASAVGLRAFAERGIRIRGREQGQVLSASAVADTRVRAALVAMCIVLLIPASIILPQYRAAWQRGTTYQRRFATALGLVQRESSRSIVFVDYGRQHDVHSSLVWNVPDLETAKTWIAYERGPDDLRLMRLAPDRRAYVFRADEGRLIRLPSLTEAEKVSIERGKGRSATVTRD